MVNLMLTYKCNEDCLFCFQKGIRSDFMMSLENFKRILDWLENTQAFREKRKVSLIGGEPTIHPRLKEMLAILKERNVSVVVFSNFVFNRAKLQLFNSNNVAGFVGTYNPKSFYRKDEWKIVDSNIAALLRKKIPVKLSYNITKSNLDYSYILDACEKFGLDTLRFSTAFPSPGRDNEYVGIDELKDIGKSTMSFVREAARRKICLDLDCTIPLCALGSEKDILFFMKHVSMKSQVCSSPLDINPDLSVYYCVPMSKHIQAKNILEFENTKEITGFFNEQKKSFVSYPFSECRGCKYVVRNLCQGGCLALKTT